MSLNALIELTNSRKTENPSVRAERLVQTRERLRQYDLEFQQRLEAEAITPALLARVCSI
jgi:hypothetical protein